jgi:glycosyltransferase involved in cell wall biosynthesis
VLRFWPRVREAVPDAELHVFYEIDNWIKMVRKGATAEVVLRADLVEAARVNAMPGVFFHGGIGQMRLAREQLMSAAMVYPCDPVQPTEGFSMTCLEAITAGCSLITTDADALRELWADAPDVTILPLPVADDIWVDTIVKTLNRTEERIPKAPRQYFWATVAQRWEQELLAIL